MKKFSRKDEQKKELKEHKEGKSGPSKPIPVPIQPKVHKSLTLSHSNLRRGRSLRVLPSHFEALGDVEPSLAASLIDPTAVFKVKMTVNPGLYSTDAAGKLNGYVSVDPGVTSYAEFGTWSNLFSEVRIVKADLIICNVNPHYDAFAAGDIKTSIPIAWDDSVGSLTPTSVNAVTDNALVIYHGLADSRVNQLSASIKDRGWASTTTTDPGPYAGCTGCFYFYQTGLTVSSPYLQFYVATEFEFRNRV